MKKIYVFYIGGILLWLLAVGFINTTNHYFIIKEFVCLMLGLSIGFFGKDLIQRRPWMLLLIPLIPLVVGFFY